MAYEIVDLRWQMPSLQTTPQCFEIFFSICSRGTFLFFCVLGYGASRHPKHRENLRRQHIVEARTFRTLSWHPLRWHFTLSEVRPESAINPCTVFSRVKTLAQCFLPQLVVFDVAPCQSIMLACARQPVLYDLKAQAGITVWCLRQTRHLEARGSARKHTRCVILLSRTAEEDRTCAHISRWKLLPEVFLGRLFEQKIITYSFIVEKPEYFR